MRVVVESWSRHFNSLKPKIKSTAFKLGRLLRLKSSGVEILLVGDNFMRKNVLAFPAPKRFPGPNMKIRSLGEIYLNPVYIKNNGENLTHMLIHGLLHLLGYDHIKKSDRIVMERKEVFLKSRCQTLS